MGSTPISATREAVESDSLYFFVNFTRSYIMDKELYAFPFEKMINIVKSNQLYECASGMVWYNTQFLYGFKTANASLKNNLRN